jgi:hypothetical protein
MNHGPDSRDSLDRLGRELSRAFASRSASIEPAAPPFETLGAPSQQPRRVLLVAASVALVAIGGLAFANLGGASDRGQGVADGEVLPGPTDGSYPVPAGGAIWACVGPLEPAGDAPTDNGAPTYWRTCTPASELDTVATVTTTIVIDAVAPAGAPDDVTGSSSTMPGPTTPSICTVPGGCGIYTVVAGDYPIAVAERFCVAVEELAAANSWQSVDEFPAPDTNILVPSLGDNGSCADDDS